MQQINFKFEIVTPLIMAGVDKNQVELREQSIKGILRWWFRFYKGASLGLKELKKEEGEIWGSQELASRIRVLIKKRDLVSGEAYLCMNDRRAKGENEAVRPYDKIQRKSYTSGKFEIDFGILPQFNLDKTLNELNNTLFFLTNFGGIGARWRRGFGSIMIKDNKNFQISGNRVEEIAEELKKKLKQFPINQSKQDFDFMNLSNTSIYLIPPKNNFWRSWEDAMNELRDNFYRELKRKLSVEAIAIGNPRKVSPLIIQIKKISKGFYGVVLICNKWDKHDECVKQIKSLNFEIKEVKT
ncbi:MAG: type III-B CRISPR module RAMP protein Cmr1 [Candidatus Ratteibacteria bacterium]